MKYFKINFIQTGCSGVADQVDFCEALLASLDVVGPERTLGRCLR